MYQEDKLTQQSVWAAHGRPDAVTSIHTPLMQKGIDMKAPSNGKLFICEHWCAKMPEERGRQTLAELEKWRR